MNVHGLIKKVTSSHQAALGLAMILITLTFGIINPSVLTLANLFALTRASIVPAILTLSLMLIMIQGGIDISFAAISSFAGYVSIFVFTRNANLDVSIFFVFAVAISVGVAIQLVNWFLIAIMKMQSLITTLAMQVLLRGAILAFISTSFITQLPTQVAALSTSFLASATFPGGHAAILHTSVLFMVVLYIIVHLILEYTKIGRNMYAIGDDPAAAQRAGINVPRTRFYGFFMAGVICGIAGVVQVILSRIAVPMTPDTVGQELTNVAAVILGIGISSKAKGSVLGTLLGVLFLRFVATNLIMIGVPSYWQRLIAGLIIFVGFVIVIQMSKKRSLKGGGNEKQISFI